MTLNSSFVTFKFSILPTTAQSFWDLKVVPALVPLIVQPGPAKNVFVVVLKSNPTVFVRFKVLEFNVREAVFFRIILLESIL